MRLAAPALACVAGCFLDTRPLESHDLGTTGPAVGNAGAGGSQTDMLPSQVATGSAGHDAAQDSGQDSAMPAPADAGPADAGKPVVTTPPPAANGMTDAGTTPPPAPDAGSAKPDVTECAGLGSYGLRAAIDVTWDATAWSDVGRGTAELLGIARVEAVDPKTHALTASFRACGMTLPTLNSSGLCSSHQLQLPQELWETGKLPEQKLGGTYKCDDSKCSLRFEPLSYSLGIQLADPVGPWPDVEDTMPSQFVDVDADGVPGVSVDVVTIASQNACVPTGPTMPGSNQGPGGGNQGPGGGGPGSQGPSTPVVPTQIGSLLLGLRTQLTAAVELAPDCQLQESSASKASVDLRSAGCLVPEGMDPTSASFSCSEELRIGYDETLPQFEALEKGKAPKSSGPARANESAGPLLKVIRFEPGAPVDCDQVRNITF